LTEDHNEEIVILESSFKEDEFNKLYNDYGRCQANLLETSSLKSKKMFRKHLKSIKAEIAKIKKLK
jgi:hypothetical protein